MDSWSFQPSVHSETASSTIFYLWVWKMTFVIFEQPGFYLLQHGYLCWAPCFFGKLPYTGATVWSAFLPESLKYPNEGGAGFCIRNRNSAFG